MRRSSHDVLPSPAPPFAAMIASPPAFVAEPPKLVLLPPAPGTAPVP
ncbi:MAG TPA: hypothetical protein VH062_09745 [Polyangiaceae bacterium]|nr:hypothetical protein [Polyangiaceae bacterium]